MRNIWIIARKEYKSYFISPVAYAVAFLIFLILGYIFYSGVLFAATQQQQGYVPDVTIILSPMIFIFLFTVPALTMRSIADERRSGTMELLLTAPVRDWELVVGKWLGGYLFVLSIILLTWIYPIILNRLIQPGLDQGLMLTGYLGVALATAAFVAIGVVVSSLFNNQIAAFFVTLGILLLLWIISNPAQALGPGASSILSYLSLSDHFYNTFNQGIIELQDIIYYLSLTGLALFLGSVSVQVRRWS
jgi:ABC-2 type transport system permease protein